jgi:hypothetical protein
MRGHQEEITRFLTSHQTEIARLTEQAYLEVRGHYGDMTAEARQQQATTDAQELIAALIGGVVAPGAIQGTLAATPTFGILNDIIRLVEAQERLFTTFVHTYLAAQPEVARELLGRMSSLAARFRMHLSAAYAARLVQYPDHPGPADVTP